MKSREQLIYGFQVNGKIEVDKSAGIFNLLIDKLYSWYKLELS